MSMRKYNWKKILIQTVWVIAGLGTIVLLGAAMQKKNQKKCADIRIELTGVERHMFIDEKDVLDILNAAGAVAGTKLSELNLRAMETVVERNPWVKNAEMFLDNNHFLQVKIEERQPVARVFTLGGSSFYLDSGAMRLPLSEKLSARVPIFTGFPSDKKILAGPDSALLNNIVTLGQYIMADSFWMAQVAQVAITPQSNFELVPVIGDHLVALGNVDELDSKFKRLYTFYRKAWLQNGINTYEKLDVQYHNQVVAVGGIKKSARLAFIFDSPRLYWDCGAYVTRVLGISQGKHTAPHCRLCLARRDAGCGIVILLHPLGVSAQHCRIWADSLAFGADPVFGFLRDPKGSKVLV